MLVQEDAALIVVDIQGKLAKIVHESEFILAQAATFIQGAKLLELPILWLEQYPKGLGPTDETIARHLTDESPIAKMTFSACENEAFSEQIRQLDRSTYFVLGIETHICVYQTVKDLLRLGKRVEVVADAVSSRTKRNKEIGLQKMSSFGAELTSVEMALFELMKTAEHPQFRKVSALVK